MVFGLWFVGGCRGQSVRLRRLRTPAVSRNDGPARGAAAITHSAARGEAREATAPAVSAPNGITPQEMNLAVASTRGKRGPASAASPRCADKDAVVAHRLGASARPAGGGGTRAEDQFASLSARAHSSSRESLNGSWNSRGTMWPPCSYSTRVEPATRWCRSRLCETGVIRSRVPQKM